MEAYRILAQIAEHDGQSSAISWRQEALAAKPGSSEDTIALAKTALQFNKIAMAEATLAKLDNSANQLPAYHEVKAQLALAKKNPAEAVQQLAEAVKLDPSNQTYQLSLAVLELQSKSANVRARARDRLRALMNDKQVRVAAARALRDDAAQNKDGATLLEISALLYGYPEASLHDRLSYVQVLHALNHRDFTGKLSELQNEAVADSKKLTELLSWMSTNGLAIFAIHWAKELSSEILNKRPVPVAVADCYVAAGDWNGLEQWCKKADWHDLTFAKHAYLSRAFRERDDNIGAQAEWNMALHDAGSDGERIYSLEQTAAKWGWRTEVETLLWRLLSSPNRQGEALAALYQYYFDKGDTGNLYRVAARACKIRPDDEDAENDLAQLSLLLNLNTDHARETAARLYQKNPKNPVFASTFGFSLYGKGLYHQAVQVMSDLGPSDLSRPTIAAYYGVFLAAAGDRSKADAYLTTAAGAPLLPEEKALVQSAREKIDSKQP